MALFDLIYQSVISGCLSRRFEESQRVLFNNFGFVHNSVLKDKSKVVVGVFLYLRHSGS